MQTSAHGANVLHLPRSPVALESWILPRCTRTGPDTPLNEAPPLRALPACLLMIGYVDPCLRAWLLAGSLVLTAAWLLVPRWSQVSWIRPSSTLPSTTHASSYPSTQRP